MNWKYENGRIYWVDEKDELMAETTYVFRSKAEVNIDYTYVNPLLRGQGVAGKMMEVVAEYLRKNSLKTTATCSYANAWLKKNKDLYSDIISRDIDHEAVSCNIDRKHSSE
ncbi:MAG: N-acetyltransferase [Clostridiales bacterium]|nr:N-acetyltransferase [Clostridiales bacterium]